MQSKSNRIFSKLSEFETVPSEEKNDPFSILARPSTNYYRRFFLFKVLTVLLEQLPNLLSTKGEDNLIKEWAHSVSLEASWVYQLAWEIVVHRNGNLEEFVHTNGAYYWILAPPSTNTLEPPRGMPNYYHYSQTQEEYLDSVSKLADEILSHPLFSHINKSFHVQAKKEISRVAKDYCLRVEVLAKEMSDVERTPNKKYLERDVEWTIQFQVQKKGYSDIAKQYNQNNLPIKPVTPKTVGMAINRILKIISLNPGQKPTRGRPKK